MENIRNMSVERTIPDRRIKRFQRGFTLIELLVVIAIIAVLMAILMPALHRVREQGKRAVCLSHLKQLALVWIMYADDNDGYIVNGAAGHNGTPTDARHPNEKPWVGACWSPNYASGEQLPEAQQIEQIKIGALWPYCKNLKLYGCPTGYRGEMLSYAIVHSMNGNPPAGTYNEIRGRRIPKKEDGVWLWVKNRSQIYPPAPAERTVFVDEGWATSYSYAVHYVQEAWWDDPAVRHGDGTTFAYADGHSEYWKWKGIDTVKMGRSRDRSHPGNYTPESAEGFNDLYKMQKATFGRLGYQPSQPW
ncbi:MAG: type II secretion system protein [Planctomycetes bacterium]|nr:type II secretion system protein [Planctomycetota bacterium]